MQKTAYEMRISDWSSDVCSSDLAGLRRAVRGQLLADHHEAALGIDEGDVGHGRLRDVGEGADIGFLARHRIDALVIGDEVAPDIEMVGELAGALEIGIESRRGDSVVADMDPLGGRKDRKSAASGK